MRLIAVSGLDMAIWDALAKAADVPLAVLWAARIGAVPAYNSNGLWLTDVATLAEEAENLSRKAASPGLSFGWAGTGWPTTSPPSRGAQPPATTSS